MSDAVKTIIDSYVRLKDRKSIEALREHRQKLRKGLQDKPASWFDTSFLMRLIDKDIEAIEAGLARL